MPQLTTPNHCPGFERLRNLSVFECKCPECGQPKEIFSDEEFYHTLFVTVRYALLAVPLGIFSSFTWENAIDTGNKKQAINTKNPIE